MIQTNDCKDKVQKQTPARVQADTNFKHASALLVAQPDEVFHHPDNKEIMHTNVLASALLITIEATNLWQRTVFIFDTETKSYSIHNR